MGFNLFAGASDDFIIFIILLAFCTVDGLYQPEWKKKTVHVFDVENGMKIQIKQECIPVGCVPSTAVVVGAGLAQRHSSVGKASVFLLLWGNSGMIDPSFNPHQSSFLQACTIGNICIISNFLFPYICCFLLHLQCMIFDISWCNRITFKCCKLHWFSSFCSFSLAQLKWSWQCWHSCIVESLWKSLVPACRYVEEIGHAGCKFFPF